MPIAFEGVSYSYADPARQEKRKSRVKRRREAGVIENPPSLEHGKPAWGADPDAVWALRDITFALDDGEFLGIAGHTGSGKSTLIQHMNGLVHPTRGRVLLDGQDLADKRAAQACRGKVGLVFQYPEYQLFAATVREDVAFGPRNLGLPADEVDRRVEAALESVRLDIVELGDKSPFELSGGQQRRVAFAGVLAMEPRILVLDEPVAGLDPVAREEFLDLIAQLHAGGLTVVMVSHSMDDLARLSDRVLVLNEGRQFAFGTPSEVFAHGDELRAIGLDVPAPQKLACELREAGVNLPQKLYNTQALATDLAAAFNPQAETDAGKGGSVRSVIMPDIAVIGRYWPGTSPLHRMDARAKLLLALALMAVVFVAQSFWGLAVCAAFVFGFFKLAGIPLRSAFKSIAPLAFIVVVTALLNVFFVQGGAVLFEWWIIRISEAGLWQAAFIACRLLLLLLGMSLLTLTTATLDITDAFEYLLRPFRRIGVPAHELSMMMGIALRFLPQFTFELQTVYRAQISRGATFSKGRLRMLASLMVPLFTSAFRHAETLSSAMDARCYHGGIGRTRLHPLTFTRLDRNGTLVIVAMLACVIATNFIPW